VAIEDRSVVDASGERPVLRRTLAVSAPSAERVHFRALTGKIERTETGFRTPELAITVPDARAVLRPGQTDSESALELLLELPLPAGNSEWTIDYELL